MNWASLAEFVWARDAVVARAARAALTPLAWVFGAVVARRNARYDAIHGAAAALPALSVGNLSVGGTGKTPFAAWCIQQLRTRGANPAVVMRGVGDDEWRVHGVLNPGIPVVVSADRRAGMVVARTRGADCVVLDDAFQHRRAPRVADVVLLSADRWHGAVRLLPAGPFREPLASLRRAHVVVVTVKAASTAQVDDVMTAVRAAAPDVPLSVARLTPGPLRLAVTLAHAGRRPDSGAPAHTASRAGPRGEPFIHPPEWLNRREICVVSAIGDPAAFEAQLRGLGSVIRRTWRFPDHHQFGTADTTGIAAVAAGSSGVVCTLKDAVKLASCWPREAPPLWYLSQSVVIERGAEAMDRALVRLLTARTSTPPTAG